jgi:hypothetical protein
MDDDREGGNNLPSGECELHIETEDETETPSDTVLALVARVLSRQAVLAPAVVAALWDDFNGQGPKSGMWWHGALDEVIDEVDPDLPPLTNPEALYAWLRLTDITVRSGFDHPLVELSFEAPFEEEHGVGVLTDGDTIRGTGYSGDVSPFKT